MKDTPYFATHKTRYGVSIMSIHWTLLITQAIITWNNIWGVLCQKQVSRAGPSNYISQYLWDVITCPCPWYLPLVQHSWRSLTMTSDTDHMRNSQDAPDLTHDVWSVLCEYFGEKSLHCIKGLTVIGNHSPGMMNNSTGVHTIQVMHYFTTSSIFCLQLFYNTNLLIGPWDVRQ